MEKFASAADKLNYYKELKKLKIAEQKRKSFHKNKDKYNRKVYTSPQRKVSKNAVYKRQQRQKARRSREKNRGNIDSDNNETPIFKNKMAKCRALKKLKDALPSTPRRKIAVLQHYFNNSPTAKQSLKTQSPSLSEKVLENIKGFVTETKQKRNSSARNIMNVISASVSGEKLSNGEKGKTARKLGIQPRRLSGGQRIRSFVLKSEKSCYEFTKRKTRADMTSDEIKKLAYDFWISPSVSRTSPNKKDIKRTRIGPKEYVSHQIHLLEKTQIEVFLEFKAKYSDIKMSQRLFESYKPFFVMQVKQKDRNTCCCRQHIEVRSLFKKCMEFRKHLYALNPDLDKEKCQIFDHLNDMCSETLCDKTAPNFACLNRICTDCGVSKLSFHSDELDKTKNARNVKWEKFEYTKIKVKGGKTRSKLLLVTKETKSGEMFGHFKSLLETFPFHQFRANWQNEQYRNITQNLPMNHAVCVHDYSENYRCTDLTEIQSSYFQRTEISIHVTILHRHAVLEVDGVDSTINAPVVINEQFFVISPDLDHDRHFTNIVQTKISDYLKSISADIQVMHEFTDGCSAQYKSRNCMGDVST